MTVNERLYESVDHQSVKPEGRITNEERHQNHCLEQLRQYIMCSGDMTPIPTVYYASINGSYIDSDVVHTCRNFEKLKGWMLDRYEGPGAVPSVEDPTIHLLV